MYNPQQRSWCRVASGSSIYFMTFFDRCATSLKMVTKSSLHSVGRQPSTVRVRFHTYLNFYIDKFFYTFASVSIEQNQTNCHAKGHGKLMLHEYAVLMGRSPWPCLPKRAKMTVKATSRDRPGMAELRPRRQGLVWIRNFHLRFLGR